jgi:polyribonucleotide nucleotidyltransferase
MYRIQINPELIGTVIGPGGKMIRKIQEEAGGATIDIEEDGTVFVGGINETVARTAIGMIEGLTKEVKPGEIYTGKVTRLLTRRPFSKSFPVRKALSHLPARRRPHRAG